jgi:RHS repeat-associated protein
VASIALGVDGTILAHTTSYDTGGRPYQLTSYNSATGRSSTNIVNQVQDLYNGLGQLTNQYQEHGGVVNTSSSLQVQYGYTLMSGGANNSNLITMTYPNSRVLHYGYDNSAIDTAISRVDYLADDNGSGSAGTHLEDYSYLGQNTIVQRAHDQPGVNVNLTYIQQSGDSSANTDAGDQYTGLDRFGQVIDQYWLKTSGPSATDRFQYGYDRDGNALYKNNLAFSNLSELYHQSSSASGDNASAYDNLNRLAGFVRGTLSSSGNNGSSLDAVSTASSLSNHAENWSLDTLGNWSSQTVDGTPTSRTHNSKNELTAVASASLSFDSNGNTTTDQIGNTYTYDAWNRLITVKNSSGSTLASYVYDARGWRVSETHSTTTTDVYFDQQWQAIEERQASAIINQYVWSQAYVDGLVLRDDNSTGGNLGISGSGLGRRMYAQQDANWNITAFIDTSGNIQERFVYDPYGNAQALNEAGTSTVSDSFNWSYLHQGGRLDPATGLYIFRNRDYSLVLGRWMQQDPKVYVDGLSLYQDEVDSPTNATDPSGLVYGGGGGYGTGGGHLRPPKGGSHGNPFGCGGNATGCGCSTSKCQSCATHLMEVGWCACILGCTLAGPGYSVCLVECTENVSAYWGLALVACEGCPNP